MRVLLVLLGMWGAGAATGATVVQVYAGQEGLDRGLADWRETSAQIEWSRSVTDVLWVAAREVERFGIDDGDLAVGGHVALGGWGLGAEASRGGDSLLPESSLRLSVDRPFGAGWVAHAGHRVSDYAAAEVTVLDVGIERYFGAWRAGWTVFRGEVRAAPPAGTAHLVVLDRYYGDGSHVGVWLSNGDEAERIAPGLSAVTPVTGYGIGGRHWLGPRLGLGWRFGHHQQGSLYTRTGAFVGILARF